MVEVSTLTPDKVSGPGLWSRADINDDMWLIKIDDAAQQEIGKFLAAYRAAPIPMYLVNPANYELTNCRKMIERARKILTSGVGFVVFDRLDLDSMTQEEGRVVYWLICNLLSHPVAQSLAGTIFHEVRDRGQKAVPGGKVRPNESNEDIAIHNDNAFNLPMPDYVALLCEHPAMQGGESRVMHLDQVYRLLQQDYPELLERFFKPFWLFRNGQHLPAEEPVLSEPMFKYQDGRLTARFGIHMVLGGYRNRGEDMDAATKAALAALEDVFAREAFQFEFQMQRGQIQVVQNLQIGHSRTEFQDYDDPEKRRCLVRAWLRDAGGPHYTG